MHKHGLPAVLLDRLPRMRFMLLLFSLSAVFSLQLSLAAVEEDGEREVILVDQPVRYVNDVVITDGDVTERRRLYFAGAMQRGEPLPRTRDEMQSVSEKIIQEMVDEELLVQKAMELGVQIDRRRLRKVIMEEAARLGAENDLRSIAEIIDLRVRNEQMRQIVGYYMSQMPRIRPEEVREYYEGNQDRFRIPGTRSVYRIQMKPAELSVKDNLRSAMLNVLRDAQDTQSAGVQDLLNEDVLMAVVEAEGIEQYRLLLALCEKISVAEINADDTTAIQVQGLARRCIQENQKFLNKEQIEKLLQEHRDNINSVKNLSDKKTAFREVAKKYSHGVEAADGGLVGNLEDEALSSFTADIFKNISENQLSDVIWHEGIAHILMYTDYVPGSISSLTEVSAEIEAMLRAEVEEGLREKIFIYLRNNSSVEKLNALKYEEIGGPILEISENEE